MLRIVLDTNVLVSAILTPEGPPGRIFEMIADGAVQIALSPSILAEYHDVLGRKKFGLAPATASGIVEGLKKLSLELIPTLAVRACNDSTDDKFLECAVAAGAACLVTGNQRHFPKLFEGIPIVSPSEFLRDIQRNSSS